MNELTLADVRDYLSIDFEDEKTDNLLKNLMGVADAYLKGAIGDNYPKEDDRAKQIALLMISDLYDNRSMDGKNGVNTRRLIDDFSLQLRMELRRKSYESSDSDTTS